MIASGWVKPATLGALDHHPRAATITVESDEGVVTPIPLPPQALRVLAETLGMMARGQAIMLMAANERELGLDY